MYHKTFVIEQTDWITTDLLFKQLTDLGKPAKGLRKTNSTEDKCSAYDGSQSGHTQLPDPPPLGQIRSKPRGGSGTWV